MKPMKKKHYVLGVLALLLLAGGVYALHVYRQVSATVLNGQDTHYLYIDADDTADSIYSKLATVATERAVEGMKRLAGFYDFSPRTGRYVIEAGQQALDVFRMLRNGQQKPVMLTVPEVRTMDRMAGRLAQKLMLDSADIAQALTDENRCRQLGYDTTTIACLFVPNTYEVYWNVSLDGLLERLQKEHDRFWEGEREQKAARMQLTPVEVCTLASIIDEETANNAEKPMIAGMYLNRLKQGMPLQADPTIKFALKQFELKRIWQNLLQTDSPYNTYQNAGLPPGPIKIASIRGIDAVLNAVSHDYLYMCAKEDFSGTHNFATTYQEHLKNAARYSKALNERGIK